MNSGVLLEAAWFNKLDPVTKSQLAVDIEIVKLEKGQNLFYKGDDITHVHYLIKGSLFEGSCNINSTQNTQLQSDHSLPLSTPAPILCGFFGNEIGFESSHNTYKYTVTANSDSHLMKIPLDIFMSLMEKEPVLSSLIFKSIISNDCQILDNFGAPTKSTSLPRAYQFWWILSVVLPLCSFYLLNSAQSLIPEDQIIFACVVLASLTLWVGEIVPIFAPGLVILVGLALLQIAPLPIVLSGFGNQTFLFMTALFVIGGLIKTSGLAFRICLLILSKAPAKKGYLASIMFLVAFILNPILPSANSRASILAPVLVDMKRNLKLEDRSPLFTLMATSLFAGISTFSFVFISAKSDNLILFTLLPEQVKESFGYGSWFLNALAVAIPLIILSSLMLASIFKECKNFSLTRDVIHNQLELLGPISKLEISAIGCIIVFLGGSVSVAFHGLSMAWIGIVIFTYLILSGIITAVNLKTMVDWPFLLFLASLIGLSNSIPYSDFDELLISSLQGVASLIDSNIYVFTVVFALIVYFLRLFLPGKLCGPLLASIFIPLFASKNITPWIVCIMILVFNDAAFFPYQNPALGNYLSLTKGKDRLDTNKFFRASWIINLFRIIALLIAIPIWKASGIA